MKILLIGIFSALSFTAQAITPATDTARAKQYILSKNEGEYRFQLSIVNTATDVIAMMQQVEDGYAESTSLDPANWTESSITEADPGDSTPFYTKGTGTITVIVSPSDTFDNTNLGSIEITWTAVTDAGIPKITSWTGTIDLTNANMPDDSVIMSNGTTGETHMLTELLGWPFAEVECV